MRCFGVTVSETSDNTASERQRCSFWPSFSSRGSSSQGTDRKSSSSSRSTGSRTRAASLPSSSGTSQSVSTVGSNYTTSSSLESYRFKQKTALRVFSYAELRQATESFSKENYIGEGGFGRVFKGLITQRSVNEEVDKQLLVAIKHFNNKGQQGYKEWLSEVKYLGRVDHPNLVKLLGYCAEDNDRGPQLLLVYEFMPGMSLDAHLFKKDLPVLTWERRLHIAVGAAKGLSYLHEGLDFQIIFRDLKPSNILLDNDFTPKLSDFGLARAGPDSSQTHVTTIVAGTKGYAAPEYIQTSRLTTKCDVWSLGVVLLELLTGRRAVDTSVPRKEQWLTDWCIPYIEDQKLERIMDPRLEGEYDLGCAERVAALACRCISKDPKSRPKSRDVEAELKEICDTYNL